MRKLHTELEIFHQPAIRNPFLLYFLLVLRTFNKTKVNISLRFRMQPLCIDEEQRQKTNRGWVTAAHWKIACLLTMAVLLVLLLIFITLYVSGQRVCGAQKGKTYVWRRMFMCSYGEGRLGKKRWKTLICNLLSWIIFITSIIFLIQYVRYYWSI